MKNIIIDTNIYSASIKDDPVVVKTLLKAESIGVPATVLGELLYGFKLGSRKNENLKKLKDFMQDPKMSIYKTTSKTAKIYSEIKHQLTKKGKPIPENDIWISASAIETNSTLITYDKHFLKIPKVKVWKNLKK